MINMFYALKQKNKELYIMVDDSGVVQKTNNKKDCIVFSTEEQAQKFIEKYIDNKRYIRNKDFIEVVSVNEYELL